MRQRKDAAATVFMTLDHILCVSHMMEVVMMAVLSEFLNTLSRSGSEGKVKRVVVLLFRWRNKCLTVGVVDTG